MLPSSSNNSSPQRVVLSADARSSLASGPTKEVGDVPLQEAGLSVRGGPGSLSVDKPLSQWSSTGATRGPSGSLGGELSQLIQGSSAPYGKEKDVNLQFSK